MITNEMLSRFSADFNAEKCHKIAMNAAREAFLDYAYIEDYGAYIQEQNPQTAEKSKNPNSGQGKTVYVEIGK